MPSKRRSIAEHGGHIEFGFAISKPYIGIVIAVINFFWIMYKLTVARKDFIKDLVTNQQLWHLQKKISFSKEFLQVLEFNYKEGEEDDAVHAIAAMTEHPYRQFRGFSIIE